MGLHILAEAFARIEYKIDALLTHLNVPVSPMHFLGAPCPVCRHAIDYQIDFTHNIVVRKCQCSTGKVPSPLLPLTQQGDPNGDPSRSHGAEDGTSGPKNGHRGKAS